MGTDIYVRPYCFLIFYAATAAYESTRAAGGRVSLLAAGDRIRLTESMRRQPRY